MHQKPQNLEPVKLPSQEQQLLKYRMLYLLLIAMRYKSLPQPD
jgi:hypothetical protein